MPDGSVMSYGAAGGIPAGDTKKVDAWLQRRAARKVERAPHEPLWQTCAKFILPRKADILVKSLPGQKRGHDLYDDTAVYSNELFAGMMHGMFTNPSTPFFGLGFEDIATEDLSDGLKEWLQDASKKIHAGFNRAGLSGYLQELYLDIGCFGTSILNFRGTATGAFHFKTIPIDQGYIAESELGVVDTMFRRFQLTARQAPQLFDFEALPKKIRECAQDPKKQDEKFWFIHAATPNTDRIRGRLDSKNLPFANCYIAEEEKTLVEERGDHEFPFHVPRWVRESGTVYGRSPGMTCLRDIQVLNKVEMTDMKGTEKAVDPAYQMPDDGFISPLRTAPNSINFYRAGSSDRIELLPQPPPGNFSLSLQKANQKREAIRNAFYVDRLQLVEGPAMTAYEVAERRDEKLKQMGPMLGRLDRELLALMIQRGFWVLFRAGKIEPPPEAPPGKLSIEYLSPLAKLQKQSYLAATDRWVAQRFEMVKVDPSALDLVDLDVHGRLTSDQLGIDQRIVRDVDAVAKIREARAAAQEQAAELAAAQSMAGTMKDGTAALNNAAQAEAAGKQPERSRPR